MKSIIKLFFIMILTIMPSLAQSQTGVLPPGYIGAIQCCNSPGQYSTYSYSFTPAQSGSDYVLFAFRQDPAYWSFGNVQVTLPGSSTNLLINGNMQYGGPVTVSTNSGIQYIQAPTHWGVVYQSGIYPAAAGLWSGSGGPQGIGQWYDGAVGSFDGIYQGLSVTAGQTYNVKFQALSTYGVANTSSIQIGVYAGPCASLGLSPANCSPASNSGFTSLATPAQTGTAGGVTVTGTTTTYIQSTTTSNGDPVITATHPTRTVNTVINGQAVVETFIDTQTSTVTPVTTTVYSTPTTVTTYSDGTSITTTGNPTVVSSSTATGAPVIVLNQATTPTTIVPAYTSDITPAQQSRYTAAQSSLQSISQSGVYISSIGNNNQVSITQVGQQQRVAGVGQQQSPIQGNNNTINITQGDNISRAGPNLIEMQVFGDFNSVTSNQGVTDAGVSTGSDLGGHYQNLQINGSFNQLKVTQVGQGNYTEASITGSNNIKNISQTGSRNQAFTSTNGNNNTMILAQSGSQNYADISLSGPGNSVSLTQGGNGSNKSTISLTNAGGPTGATVIQSGSAVFSLQTTCVTGGGCAPVSIRQ
jgi:fibronectin-binding autotransporter adhesin